MYTTAFTDSEAELGVLLQLGHGPHPVQQHGPGGGGDHDGRRVPAPGKPVPLLQLLLPLPLDLPVAGRPVERPLAPVGRGELLLVPGEALLQDTPPVVLNSIILIRLELDFILAKPSK